MKQLTDRYICCPTKYCMDAFLPRFDIVRIYANPFAGRNITSNGINYLIMETIQSDFGLNARSVAYNCSGNDDWMKMEAYMMFDKGQDAYEKVRAIVERNRKLKVSLIREDEISLKIEKSNSFRNAIVQLLLGYIDNSTSMDGKEADSDMIWNNTLGRTLYFGSGEEWHRKWTDCTQHFDKNHLPTWSGEDFLGQDIKVGLSIKIDRNGIFQMHAETYVLLDYERAFKANLHYGYKFDRYNRFLPARQRSGKTKLWYRQGEATHPSTIRFINYGSYKSFMSSRMGVFAAYLNQIERKIGKGSKEELLDIIPWPYNGDVIKVLPVLNDNEVQNTCIRKARKRLTISTLDISETDTSTLKAIGLIKEVLREKFSITEVGDVFDESGFNIVIHHDKDYYARRNGKGNNGYDARKEFSKEHPHASIQGITWEEFVRTLPRKPLYTGNHEEDEKAEKQYNNKVDEYMKRVLQMLRVNLISLAIKHDILLDVPKVTIFDMGKFQLLSPIWFAIRIPEKKSKTDNNKSSERFYYMRLSPDGRMKFGSFDRIQHHEKELYGYIVQGFQKNAYSTKDADPNIELLAWTNVHDIYKIVKTEEHSLPDVRAILEGFKNVAKTMTKTKFWSLYDEFCQRVSSSCLENVPTEEELIDYREKVKNLMEKRNLKEEDTYPHFQKCISGRPELKMRKTYYAFTNFLKEEKGIDMDPHIRKKDNAETFAVGNLQDGWHFPTPDYLFQLGEDEKQEVVTNCDHLDNLQLFRTLPWSETYCIGKKDSLEATGPSKGSLYRRIERINHQPLDKDFTNLLMSMNIVDFVKLGSWTVKPYPVKYLNEYKSIKAYGDGDTAFYTDAYLGDLF